MKYSVFALFLWVAMGCSKSDSLSPSNDIVGTWRLATYCKPTSSSACTTVDVPANKGVFISFDRAGRFTETYENTKPVEYAFLGCGSGSYSLEGDSVRITAVCMSSLGGKLMPLISVNANRLVLRPFDSGEYIFVR